MERLSTYSRIMLGMLLIFSQYASGANYYFSSKSGDDARTVAQAQNPETPWKSIEKLNAIFQTLQPGDAIYFKSGEIFFGTIHINKSGTASNPIKIGAYGPGAKPVITSLVTLDKWKSTGSGKVESQNALNTSEVKVLVIDGELQELGRFPNSDTANEGYLTIDGVSGTNSITGNKLPGNPNWKGAEVVIKKNQWVIDATKIILSIPQKLGQISFNFKYTGCGRVFHISTPENPFKDFQCSVGMWETRFHATCSASEKTSAGTRSSRLLCLLLWL